MVPHYVLQYKKNENLIKVKVRIKEINSELESNQLQWLKPCVDYHTKKE